MSKSDRGLTVLRDACIIAAIALLTFQGLRRYLGDYYRVPTGSMEPVLHGDAREGDVVFVLKCASAAAPRRNDLVVVRHPEDSDRLLVKRIAARGDDRDGCWIDLRQGNVWLGSGPNDLRPEVKDPLASRGMRVTWAKWPWTSASEDGLDMSALVDRTLPITLPPMAAEVDELRRLCRDRAAQDERGAMPGGAIGTTRQVDATYVSIDGARGPEGADVGVFDCGLEVTFASGMSGAVVGVLENSREIITFVWSPADGRLEVWRNGEDVRVATLPARTGAHRIEFGQLDDQLFFAVDGRAETLISIARDPAWNKRDGEHFRGPRSHLWLGFVGLGRERPGLADLTVFRDVYYERVKSLGVVRRAKSWPKQVRPGHWFLLGDNAFDSRDSRFLGSQPASSFVGRPWFVLGPRSRLRWLPE